jgi:hypothetical protein
MVDSWTRSRRYPDQMRPISGSDTPPLYLPAEQMGCTRRATNLGGPRTTCIIRRPGAMTAIVGGTSGDEGIFVHVHDDAGRAAKWPITKSPTGRRGAFTLRVLTVTPSSPSVPGDWKFQYRTLDVYIELFQRTYNIDRFRNQEHQCIRNGERTPYEAHQYCLLLQTQS